MTIFEPVTIAKIYAGQLITLLKAALGPNAIYSLEGLPYLQGESCILVRELWVPYRGDVDWVAWSSRWESYRQRFNEDRLEVPLEDVVLYAASQGLLIWGMTYEFYHSW